MENALECHAYLRFMACKSSTSRSRYGTYSIGLQIYSQNYYACIVVKFKGSLTFGNHVIIQLSFSLL